MALAGVIIAVWAFFIGCCLIVWAVQELCHGIGWLWRQTRTLWPWERVVR